MDTKPGTLLLLLLLLFFFFEWLAYLREQEASFLQTRDDSLGQGTTWQRIADLIDLQDSRSKTVSKSTHDLSRFKEILLSLKREGATAPGAAGYWLLFSLWLYCKTHVRRPSLCWCSFFLFAKVTTQSLVLGSRSVSLSHWMEIQDEFVNHKVDGLSIGLKRVFVSRGRQSKDSLLQNSISPSRAWWPCSYFPSNPSSLCFHHVRYCSIKLEAAIGLNRAWNSRCWQTRCESLGDLTFKMTAGLSYTGQDVERYIWWNIPINQTLWVSGFGENM